MLLHDTSTGQTTALLPVTCCLGDKEDRSCLCPRQTLSSLLYLLLCGNAGAKDKWGAFRGQEDAHRFPLIRNAFCPVATTAVSLTELTHHEEQSMKVA